MQNSKHSPPKYAQKFLTWILKQELAEEVLGDLEEKFYKKLEKESPFQAKRNYWYQTFNYLRPFALKSNILNHLNPFFMFKNYFKVTYRLFSKNKTYLLINSLGLGVAISCCIAAYLFFAFNIEFDAAHKPEKVANIFKIHAKVESKTGEFFETMDMPSPFAPTAAMDIAGINRYTRYINSQGFIQNKEKSFREPIYFADSTFFDLFDFPLIKGDFHSFKDKHSIFLSAQLSEKLFGSSDPIGKDLKLHFQNEKEVLVTVGGIVEKMPENSTFVYDAIIRYEHYPVIKDLAPNDWSDWRDPATFIELSSAEMAPAITTQLAKYKPIRNKARTDVMVKDYRLEPFLSNFTNSEMQSYVHLRMNPIPLTIFGIMALMILLIACFNLTNTSIAMSAKRLKEIGVRKAIGATQKQIITQFLTETMLTMVIALLIGFLLAKSYLLPEFTTMFELGYGMEDLNGMNLFIALLLVLFAASLLAGIYPALFNSRMNPVKLVKGDVKIKGTNWFTRTLIATQFALSVVFLIGGTMFYQNNLFMEKIDFGYATDQLIAVDISSEKEYTILKNEISNNPKIRKIAGTSAHIGQSAYTSPVEVNQEAYKVRVLSIGKEYLETIGINFISGQEVDLGNQYTPKGNVIVNQAFLEKTGITDPFNQQVILHEEKRQIVGVVENHVDYPGTAHLIKPFIYFLTKPADYNTLVVNTKPSDLGATYSYLKNTWHQQFPDKPFSARFQDEVVLGGYRHGNGIMGKVFFFLTLLGTLLSLAGIFAMASLNIAKRTKEISIRKVLGASISSIVNMMNREFIIILSMAALVGGTIGFFIIDILMTEFFKYHIPVSFLPVTLCALCLFIVGVLTTSITILKVAFRNPIKGLKMD